MSASTKGYRVAGEPVADAVGEEFGRLIAERDRLVNSAAAGDSPYLEALQKLMAVHQGFPDGPCLCAAHENARELLAGDGTPGPAREAALTEAEVEAVSWFFQYGATRGNHSDEGRGPSPGPLTPHIDAMASAMRKIRVLASGDSGGPRETWQDWRLAAATINLLPDPLRKYIHDLETRCDPAGDVQRIASLEEQVGALVALRAELGRAGTVEDGDIDEAENMRRLGILDAMEAVTWEQSAKLCEEYAASAHPMAKLELRDIATALRARGADAERREPAP